MTDMFSLKGRVALVTGSAQGLGNTIARGMKEAGATVVLNDVNPKVLEAAMAEMGAPGYVFDISNEAQVISAVERIEREVGGTPEKDIITAVNFLNKVIAEN